MMKKIAPATAATARTMLALSSLFRVKIKQFVLLFQGFFCLGLTRAYLPHPDFD